MYLDEDLAEEVLEITATLREFREVWKTRFLSHPHSTPHPFAPTHHDLTLSNILVDPATLKITGIVDQERTGTRRFWEERFPVFVEGHNIEEEPEPQSGR